MPRPQTRVCIGALASLLVISFNVDARAEPMAEDLDAPLRVGTRVHFRYRVQNQNPDHEFILRRARLFAEAEPMPWLRAQLDFDIADAPGIRDAYARIEIARWLRIQAGRYRKAYSRIQNTTTAKLPLIRRGLVDNKFTDDLQFGGRDVGIGAEGRLGDFRYEIGAFNGTGSFDEVDSAKDFATRIRWRPVKPLQFGVSGSLKHRNPQGISLARNVAFAAAFDARYEKGPIDIVSETQWGQDHFGSVDADALGTLAYVRVKIPLPRDLSLRPIVRIEFLDDDLRSPNNTAWGLLAGINLKAPGGIRVMVQGEQRLAEDGSSTSDRRSLIVQLAFDEEFELQPFRKVQPEGDEAP